MDIPQLLHSHWLLLRPLCAKLELTLHSPTDAASAANLGRALNLRTPPELQIFLTTISAQISLEYTFRPHEKRLNPIAKQVAANGAQIGIHSFKDLITSWESWADSWETGAKGPLAENLAFEQLFPLAESLGGCALALLDTGRPQSPVLFLDPEGGEFDGITLANSFTDFIATWCNLACPDIQALPLFHSKSENKLSPDTDFAQKWRTTLGLA